MQKLTQKMDNRCKCKRGVKGNIGEDLVIFG